MTDASRLEALYIDALNESPEARAAFLDRACAGDRALRARVDQLLAAEPYVREFLEGLPPTVPAADVAGVSSGLAGTVVGDRYKLAEPIGEGGMGEVWVADQLKPVRRHVALKLIKPGMDSRAVLARFEQERQALALMDHPNIAKVLDAGTADGRPFFVMELVKGTPITEFCDARKLSPRERLELYVPVCQAIQHAHTKGIIHRDIKPGNVLVALYDDTPVPKVIDFGIAKAVSSRLTDLTVYTGFGALVGTPAYMAPEQATFNQLDTDTRADVYALGVLLYELLTGSPPFDVEQLQKAGLEEVLRVVREEDPPRPSARLSTSRARATIASGRRSDPDRLERLFRGELDWIVMKCLEKDRTRRYETAAALAADVERYLADEPVLACPPSPLYRARKIVRRHKAAAFAAGLAAVALVAATAVSGWFANAAGAAAQDAVGQAKEAKSAAAREATEKEQAWRHLYVARMQSAQWAWREGNLPRLRELLAETRPAAGQPDLRGFEWRYFDRVGHTDPLVLRYGNGVRHARFSADGRRVIAAGETYGGTGRRADAGSVVVYDAASGRTVRTVPGKAALGAGLAVAAAGDRMARIIGTAVEVWDLAADRLEARLVSEVRGYAVAFSPDGKRLAVGHGSGLGGSPVTVWDVAAGRILHTFPGHASYTHGVAFTPDGRRVVSGGSDGAVRVWDAEAGGLAFEAKTGARAILAVAVSPDGKRIAAPCEHAVKVLDAATGAEVRLLTGHVGTVTSVAFSPDGKVLASGSSDRTVRFWDPADGTAVRTLRGHGESVWDVAFSPDGKRLASASRDGTVRVWDTAVDPEVQLLEWGVSVAYSPDGRLLATGHGFNAKGNNGIAIRDAETGKERLRLEGPGGAVAFSPDGTRLATPAEDRELRVWDTGTGKSAVRLETGPGGWRHAWEPAYSPDGKVLAAAATGKDGRIHLWDATTGDRLRTIDPARGLTGAAAYSPDGKSLAAGTGDGVTEWDPATGAEVRTRPVRDGTAGAVAYSPDGAYLA
ncbi:MAG TPA: protein kinase, partial [Gemmataceae bacterium]|nr:protein kinase [Gemmataceae bacterium]